MQPKHTAYALAVAISLGTFLGAPAGASAYPPRIKHPDFRGTLESDSKAVVTIDIVAGGSELRFQAREVRFYCDDGSKGRMSFETHRTTYTRGSFAIDKYYFSSNSPFTSDSQRYYSVHGGRTPDGLIRGRLAYFYDSVRSEEFPEGSADCSTFGPRSWVARPVN